MTKQELSLVKKKKKGTAIQHRVTFSQEQNMWV